MILLFLAFLIVAMITVFTAIKLSTYADVISEKTAVGGMLIGSMLLAGATSLPEITTSYTSIMLNNPDLAVGNILGSNLFNLVILAALDLYFRRDQLFEKVWLQHRYTAALGIILMVLIFVSLKLPAMYIIVGVGIDSMLFLLVYILGLTLISKLKQTPKKLESIEERSTPVLQISANQAMKRFLLAAIIILVSGSILTFVGDRIAIVTGLGASFVGSFLIAASTSLPEAVACFVACRIRNFNLAIGSILGSNLFNVLILCGTDIFYRNGPLLVHVEAVHELTAGLVIMLYFITYYLLIRVNPKTKLNYSTPSLMIIFTYFVASYYIFIYS